MKSVFFALPIFALLFVLCVAQDPQFNANGAEDENIDVVLPEDPRYGEVPPGAQPSVRRKRATCVSWNGGTACRKKCQQIKDKNGHCYCTGSCEWSWVGLICKCKDASCNC